MKINFCKIQKEIENFKNQLITQEVSDQVAIKQKIDLLENKKNFVFQIITILISFIFLITTLIFSYFENQRNYKEFMFRSRPYIIIDNVEGNTDMVTTKSEYRIFLKNVGNIPAKIIFQLMACPSASTTPSMPKKDIIGINQSIVYPFSLQGVKETNCTLNIKYVSAIENFSSDKYETQQEFLYKLGEQMGSGGGFMR